MKDQDHILVLWNTFEWGIKVFVVPTEDLSEEAVQQVLAANECYAGSVDEEEDQKAYVLGTLLNQYEDEDLPVGSLGQYEVTVKKEGDYGSYSALTDTTILQGKSISHVVISGFIP